MFPQLSVDKRSYYPLASSLDVHEIKEYHRTCQNGGAASCDRNFIVRLHFHFLSPGIPGNPAAAHGTYGCIPECSCQYGSEQRSDKSVLGLEMVYEAG